MRIEVPRGDATEAPFLDEIGKYAAMPPVAIGTLTATEATAFSLPFSWAEVPFPVVGDLPANSAVYNMQPEITVNDTLAYEFPDELAQYAPALTRIAGYEHARFPRFIPQVMALTVRQRYLQCQETHQPIGSRIELHRDSRLGTMNRFYVVADRQPTEFYDQLHDLTTRDFANPGNLEPSFIPSPYEIAGASCSAFHRSPVIVTEGVRTFARVTFGYFQTTRGGI